MDNSFDRFFKAIGNNKPLFASSRTKTGMRAIFRKEIADKNHKNSQHDIYFVVNPSRGFKKEDVTSLCVNFIDLDCPKIGPDKLDNNSKILSFKNRALKRMHCFERQPTAIVQTKNGLQIYYAFKPEKATAANRTAWQNRQNTLFEFYKDYGADPKVLKPNQLLRVPRTYWYKQWVKGSKAERLSPFFCEATYLSKSLVKISETPNLKIEDAGNSSYKYSTEPKSKLPLSPSFYKPDEKNGSYRDSNTSTNDMSELVALLGDVASILYAKQCKFLAQQVKKWQDKLTYG